MGNLTICVTVDWEGLDLKAENFRAMADLRKVFGSLPLTHFICPAYLTRGGEAAPIVAQIRSAICKNDEVGVHVHCWESLVTSAGVPLPHNPPTWYVEGYDLKVHYGDHGQIDKGHGVPLGSYSVEDAGKIIVHAIQLLTQVVDKPSVSFRCGGWMSADHVQTALREKHVLYDSSSTDAPYFRTINSKIERSCKLGTWVPQLWGTAESDTYYLANTQSRRVEPAGGNNLSQPYAIPKAVSFVLQVPDNGVLADYLTAQLIYDRLHEAWGQAAARNFVHVCGFHQESATKQNIYRSPSSNLFNFATALALFLHDVGVSKTAVAQATLTAVGIVPKNPAAVRPVDAHNMVFFGTVDAAMQQHSLVELRYVAPDELKWSRDLADESVALQDDMTGRFFG